MNGWGSAAFKQHFNPKSYGKGGGVEQPYQWQVVSFSAGVQPSIHGRMMRDLSASQFYQSLRSDPLPNWAKPVVGSGDSPEISTISAAVGVSDLLNCHARVVTWAGSFLTAEVTSSVWCPGGN